MQRIIILGYGENVLSLVLESLKGNGNTGPFLILQNIPVENNVDNKYIPDQVSVEVLLATSDLQLPDSGHYIFGVASPHVKKAVFNFFFQNYKIEHESYMNLFHSTTVVASSAEMSKGCYIEPLSIISPFAKIGFGVTVNRGAAIGHHSVLEDFVTIGPGVNIAGQTQIGEGTQVGIGAIIFDHLTIGKNCTIGGGSVVTKNIPDNTIAWGNPCSVIRQKSIK